MADVLSLLSPTVTSPAQASRRPRLLQEETPYRIQVLLPEGRMTMSELSVLVCLFKFDIFDYCSF